MKEIWINLELYFESVRFFSFLGIFLIFMNFSWIFKDFLELKINFSYILKCVGDVVWSGSSDCVAINGYDREVTWLHMERLITQRIVTVDDHLRHILIRRQIIF